MESKIKIGNQDTNNQHWVEMWNGKDGQNTQLGSES